MPGLDGTGPRGIGAMTGRGMGNCVIPISTHDEEIIYLKKRVDALTEELEQIEVRFRTLENAESSIDKETAR